MAHHRHPAQPLEEKFVERFKIGNRLDRVRQQLYFKTLSCNQSPDKQIVRGAVLNRGVAAESGEMLSRRHDRLSEGELYSIQLPGDHYPGLKIAKHADGLELLEKRVFVRGHIQACDGAHFGIT